MRKTIILTLIASVLASCGGSGQKVALKNETDSVSYVIALDVARRMKKMGIEELNLKAVQKAFENVYGKDTSAMFTPEQTEMIAQAFFMKLQERKMSVDKKEGEDFLAKNKTANGVITLPSGLQYQVVKEGSGATPKDGDTVMVNYTGSLTNGKIFDSNKGEEPVKLMVNEVIHGWTEALKMMKEGTSWKIFVPADLAYGSSGGPGNRLPPYSVLVFDIELVKVVLKK